MTDSTAGTGGGERHDHTMGMGRFMSKDIIPSFTGSTLAIYDLRDEVAWARARRERAAWGKQNTKVHTIDNDHVVIEFLPGGAMEARAS